MFFGACGSQTDTKTATQAMTATAGASNVVLQKVQLKVDSSSGSFSLNETVTNPSGAGTATVVGNGTNAQGSSSMTLTVTLNGWSDLATGIVLNGSLSSSLATTIEPRTANLHEEGHLSLSGKVSGSYSFDITIKNSGTASSVCGNVDGTQVSLPSNASC
jgi:hypothetical protein